LSGGGSGELSWQRIAETAICRLQYAVHIGVQVVEKVSNRIHASPATGFIILHVRIAIRSFCEVAWVRAEVRARKQPLPLVHSI
jgi:hypothetical protein